jgi:hypothetical protein
MRIRINFGLPCSGEVGCMCGCDRTREALFGDRHVTRFGRRYGGGHGSRSDSEASQTGEQEAA